jgi:hypothetical protein
MKNVFPPGEARRSGGGQQQQPAACRPEVTEGLQAAADSAAGRPAGRAAAATVARAPFWWLHSGYQRLQPSYAAKLELRRRKSAREAKCKAPVAAGTAVLRPATHAARGAFWSAAVVVEADQKAVQRGMRGLPVGVGRCPSRGCILHVSPA